MTDNTPKTLSEHHAFGGVQRFLEHRSHEIGLPMRFSVYLPPQVAHEQVPALLYLAGLTCNEETFAMKAGAQRMAASLGLALIAPDTSPRGREAESIPGAKDDWDFGIGAGFYLDALVEPWATHWRMESWVVHNCCRWSQSTSPSTASASASSATRWAATARSPWRCGIRGASSRSRPLRRSARPRSAHGARRRSAAIWASPAPTVRSGWRTTPARS
jgi:S-formylglutathione hydrolase FrmB